MIEINNLSVEYGNKKVLDNISLSIGDGQLALIKGGNGTGKSTLCYAISRIIPRNIDADIKGSILIDNVYINAMSQAELVANVGIVVQNPDNMLFSPTVIDEVAFAGENLCIERVALNTRVEKAMKLAGIEHLRYSTPSKLSGGEKIRVAIASVLTLDSKIIIMDEVMSSLDRESKKLIIDMILKLREEGKIIIVVEHSDILDNIADKIINLKRLSDD